MMMSLIPAWLVNLVDRLRTSFWFLPFLMALTAVALAFLMAHVDRLIEPRWREGVSWIYKGGAEGARAVLSTLAGSMITVAGVVYSITVVVLTLASSQFGPRLMRNFTGDRVNQSVLGVFVASFVYCLLVLRGIGAPQAGSTFVPNLSVTVGVGLGVLSILVLIYFIHHIATSIQAFSVISTIGRELQEQIGELFPQDLGEGGDDGANADPAANAAVLLWVTAPRGGYLRLIDDGRLERFAVEHDVVVDLKVRPGDFLVRGEPLAAVRAERELAEPVLGALAGAFILGDQRTNVQDAHFSIDQLVEIALRALSPGINDPFTAIQCVHRLGEALARVARLAMPSPRRLVAGEVRVLAPAPTFAALISRAIDPIRLAAARQPQVLAVLLETLSRVHRVAPVALRRRCLEEHAAAIVATGDRFLSIDRDQMLVRRAAQSFDTAPPSPR